VDTRETHGEYNYQPSRASNTIAEDRSFDYSPVALGALRCISPYALKTSIGRLVSCIRSVSKQDQDDLITNLVGDLSQVTNPDTVLEMVSHFYKADVNYGTRLAESLHLDLHQVEARAAKL
jgi:catalase